MSLLYMLLLCFFFFKQKTAYEMRISDWSSDVCSSDLERRAPSRRLVWRGGDGGGAPHAQPAAFPRTDRLYREPRRRPAADRRSGDRRSGRAIAAAGAVDREGDLFLRPRFAPRNQLSGDCLRRLDR